MSDFISKKQIVSIREFLDNYCRLRCNWKGKLTHKRMDEYLSLKGKHISRGKIGVITKEEKLTGDYIYVRDETGKVIPYKNPNIDLKRLEVSLLLLNKQQLEKIRSNYLKEENLMYDEYGRVITVEEYNERCRINKELEDELIQNKKLDEEYSYYEKMSQRNRKIKMKKYYISRRG